MSHPFNVRLEIIRLERRKIKLALWACRCFIVLLLIGMGIIAAGVANCLINYPGK